MNVLALPGIKLTFYNDITLKSLHILKSNLALIEEFALEEAALASIASMGIFFLSRGLVAPEVEYA